MANAKTERAEIIRDGGKPQKNSGRGQIQKGDAKLEPFIYDVKEYSKSFDISRSVWVKTTSDAIKGGMEPALKLVIGDEGEVKIRLWVISDDMFHQMLEAWSEKYE